MEETLLIWIGALQLEPTFAIELMDHMRLISVDVLN